MARLHKQMPFRELTIPVKMLRGWIKNRDKRLTPYAESSCAGGSLTLKDDIPLVRVRGSHLEIGKALGELVGVQAAEVHRSYMSVFAPDMQGDLQLCSEMERHLPVWMLDEIRGMAQTCDLSYDELLWAQSFLDIHKVAACSTICAHDDLTTDGQILMGRNLDFPSLSIAHECNLVVVYKPDDCHPHAAVTWPGFLGTLTGMNKYGLSLAMMLVYGQTKSEHLAGQPFPTVFRDLLQRCKTLQQAEELLTAKPYCTATNTIIADKQRNAARFQLHPEIPVVDHTSKETPAITCTNHFFDKRIKKFAFTYFSSKARHRTIQRYTNGKLDVSRVKNALQSTGIPNINLQRTIMQPETGEMHVAFKDLGRGPGEWVTFDADELFGN
ncbi:MAG: C45 family autoproteolytic acyltransferase/hydrolase [Planctomycetota bacterium]|jgi:predicted choloylglycine hydrolase